MMVKKLIVGFLVTVMLISMVPLMASAAHSDTSIELGNNEASPNVANWELSGAGVYEIKTGTITVTGTANAKQTFNLAAGTALEMTTAVISAGGVEFTGAGTVTISGGSITGPVIAAQSITISGGTVAGTIDGSETVAISGGTVNATGGADGIKGATVNITGGTITATGTTSAITATGTLTVSTIQFRGGENANARQGLVVASDSKTLVAGTTTAKFATTIATGAITAASVTGIAAPVRGETGSTSVTSGDTTKYTVTGTPTWTPALTNGVFAGDTTYTLTVELTAAAGHWFEGNITPSVTTEPSGRGTAAQGTVDGTSVGNKLTFVITFTKTEAPPTTPISFSGSLTVHIDGSAGTNLQSGNVMDLRSAKDSTVVGQTINVNAGNAGVYQVTVSNGNKYLFVNGIYATELEDGQTTKTVELYEVKYKKDASGRGTVSAGVGSQKFENESGMVVPKDTVVKFEVTKTFSTDKVLWGGPLDGKDGLSEELKYDKTHAQVTAALLPNDGTDPDPEKVTGGDTGNTVLLWTSIGAGLVLLLIIALVVLRSRKAKA